MGAQRRDSRHGTAAPAGHVAVRLLLALSLAWVQAACQPAADHGSEAEPAARLAAPADPRGTDEVAAYEGAWFKVEAPADFTARPSLESDSAEGYDSVFFDSPDGRAAFYVCSPQWGREAVDVALDPATESLLSEESSEEGERVVRRLRIAARDGSYERLVEEIVAPASGTGWTFGFRYADAAARREHLGRYQAFKASLVQYAD